MNNINIIKDVRVKRRTEKKKNQQQNQVKIDYCTLDTVVMPNLFYELKVIDKSSRVVPSKRKFNSGLYFSRKDNRDTNKDTRVKRRIENKRKTITEAG